MVFSDIRFLESFLFLIKDCELLKPWGNPVIKPDPSVIPYIKSAFERLFNEHLNNGLNNIDFLQAYLNLIFYELTYFYRPILGRNNNSAVLASKFRELLNLHIREKHLVSDYASMLNVSQHHLTMTMKDLTGLSASNWIDQTIILEAKVLLVNRSHGIGDIASHLGIYDQSYFSRLFKKYEGSTPQEFRKRSQKS